MAKGPSVEEAVERARRSQEDRMSAIRVLAEARQSVTDVCAQTDRERADFEARIAQRVSDAERDDVKAYNAAVSTGWSADELRKIGFGEPEKKARTRRRNAHKVSVKQATTSPSSDNAERTSDDALMTAEAQPAGA